MLMTALSACIGLLPAAMSHRHRQPGATAARHGRGRRHADRSDLAAGRGAGAANCCSSGAASGGAVPDARRRYVSGDDGKAGWIMSYPAIDAACRAASVAREDMRTTLSCAAKPPWRLPSRGPAARAVSTASARRAPGASSGARTATAGRAPGANGKVLRRYDGSAARCAAGVTSHGRRRPGRRIPGNRRRIPVSRPECGVIVGRPPPKARPAGATARGSDRSTDLNAAFDGTVRRRRH